MAQVRVWEFPQDYHIEMCPLDGNPTGCDWSAEKGHRHYAEQYGKDHSLQASRGEFELNATQWLKAFDVQEVK